MINKKLNCEKVTVILYNLYVVPDFFVFHFNGH